MKFNKLLKSAAIVSSLLLAGQASAWEWTMNFNNYYDNNGDKQQIRMGDILSDQYSSGYVWDRETQQVVYTGVGATISADNYHSSADPDFAVALNTKKTSAASYDENYASTLNSDELKEYNKQFIQKVKVDGQWTERVHFDSDLEAPFEPTNTNNDYNNRNIVILQEDGSSNTFDGQSFNPEDTCYVDNDPTKAAKGYCTHVDDQGGTKTVSSSIYDNLGYDVPDEVKNNNLKKAGHVVIDLTDSVTLKSINFFDIAGDNNPNDLQDDELTYVVTYDEYDNVIETVQVPGMGEGSLSDNKWAKVNFSAADTVRRIFISLGGSGGFSDIKLAKVAQEVSEPAMLAVFMLAIGGLVARNRKQKIAA